MLMFVQESAGHPEYIYINTNISAKYYYKYEYIMASKIVKMYFVKFRES